MGLREDAEPLYRRALEARERTLGAEHPNTLLSVNNLALCLQGMGMLKDAEPLYRRALEAQERTLGAEHPHTLLSVNNLAECLRAMGLPKDAEPLYRRALEAQRAHSRCGASSHIVLSRQFGRLPQSHGHAERCRAALQESFGGAVSALSVRSILTHWSQSTIWQVASRAMGLREDAEPLYRRALEARERTLGAEHPNTLLSVNNLALCLQGMGMLKDAEPLYRRALEAQERTLGAEHPHTLLSVNNLAECLRAMGLPKDAEPLCRRVLEAQ